jgi:eukaryotic-like serine/threonine-protein kinase
MAVFDGYRIKKSIEILLSSRNATGPEATEAVAKLKSIGKAAVPKVIDALAKTQTPELLLEVLTALLHNATLPLFMSHLSSHDPRIVTGVTSVLTQGKTYDPNQLLGLFTDPKVPKVMLAKILAAQQSDVQSKDLLEGSRVLVQARPGESRYTLQPKNLLEVLDLVNHDDCQVLLRCIDQVATADILPEIIRRLPKGGDLVRLHFTRTLARFQEASVRDTLVQLLQDPHAPVRQAALEGLMSMTPPVDVGIICPLLRDTERSIRREAVQFLAQRREQRILPYLFDLFRDSAADIRQGALELFKVVGTPETFRATVQAYGDSAVLREILDLLLMDAHVAVRVMALEGMEAMRLAVDVDILIQLLHDRDIHVRRKVIALLSQCQDPKLVARLLQTLQDESDAVRQGAVEVLNVLRSPQVIRELLSASHNAEPWIKSRIIEALGKGASAPLIQVVLTLVKEKDESIRRQAMHILQQKPDEETLQTLLQALQSEDAWSQECAAEALAALGDKRAVPALVHMMQKSDTARSLVAIRTLAALKDPQAIAPLLAYLKKGDPPVREEAMRALATLTDAAHAGTVLQAVMAARSTNDGNIRELANTTATMVIRRFGDHAVLRSPTTAATSAAALAASTSSARSTQRNGSAPDETAAERFSEEPVGDAATPLEHVEVLGDNDQEAGSPDMTNIKPGMLLANRYRIGRQVGRGGFGTVYLVEDMKIHEEIILKFLNAHIAADENMVGRFIHELRYARRVTHENVIRIHDLLTFGNICAISMEYFPSHSLSEEVRGRQPLPLQRGLQIILDVCRGMSVAHQAKVVHRDLKPPNILINDEGIVKIVDFGLAAAVSGMDTRLTATGAVLGTPAYMAPEQVRSGIIVARTDVYSLGIIMYEIFTGRPPYIGDNALSVLFQHVEGKATPPREKNPRLSPALEAIILHRPRKTFPEYGRTARPPYGTGTGTGVARGVLTCEP